jgi:hypothetical protein
MEATAKQKRLDGLKSAIGNIPRVSGTAPIRGSKKRHG